MLATLAGARDAREDVDGKDDTPSGDVLGLRTRGRGERMGKAGACLDRLCTPRSTNLCQPWWCAYRGRRRASAAWGVCRGPSSSPWRWALGCCPLPSAACFCVAPCVVAWVGGASAKKGKVEASTHSGGGHGDMERTWPGEYPAVRGRICGKRSTHQ